MIGPLFFIKKYINGPIFLDSCVKGPIFLTSWYMHIFFAQRFFEAAYPLGITWIDCDICVITSKKWVQKVKGQYMNRSAFWMIKYTNGSVVSKARYMNGVGFEILARTPVSKLPLSYPSPPPPPEVSTISFYYLDLPTLTSWVIYSHWAPFALKTEWEPDTIYWKSRISISIRLFDLDIPGKKLVKLFANSGDPKRGVWSGSALFVNYHFRGLQNKMD